MKGILIRRLLPSVALASLAALALSQPTSYSLTQTRVRAGILLLRSTSGFWGAGVPTNADPYVFFNLDRRTDLKPPGWVFENPLASKVVTPAMEARWQAILGGANPFQTGETLGKNMAPYWEVDLDQISEDKITQYDILMIHAPGGITLNSQEREKLRLFVDAGGTLWFDKSTSQAVDGFNGFPISFLTTNAGSNPIIRQPRHPILNYPYPINPLDASVMGAHQGTHAIVRSTLANVGYTGDPGLVQNIDPDFDRFNYVITNSSGIVVGVASIGTGFFVVTSGNITSALNEPAGGTNIGLGANSGPIAGTNIYNIPSTEIKFLYNMIALSAGHPALSKGTRRPNASLDDLGAPLLRTWQDTSIFFNPGDHTNYFPPSVYKGLVFICDNNRLYAYKADPSRDLDGDGLADDGRVDASVGASFDLVWRSTPLNGPMSSPLCIEVANPAGGVPRNQVYVVDRDGRVNVFNSHPRDAAGRLLGPSDIPPVTTINWADGQAADWDLSLDNRGPYSPIHMEGLVYVFDPVQNGPQVNGRVWVIDAASLQRMRTGGKDWSAVGIGSPNVSEPGSAATIGYIPISEAGGGLDRVIYVANRSTLTGATAGITSIWVGARGESPTYSFDGVNVTITTRAATKGLSVYLPGGLSSYGLNITWVDQNGDPVPVATVNSWNLGPPIQFSPGQIRFSANGIPGNVSPRVDYYIDWGTANVIGRLIRGQLFMPDDIQRERTPLKSLALAPNGNLFVVTGNETRGGSLFCLREYSRGAFRLIYRWDLHDGYTVTLNGTTNVTVPSAILERDDLWTLFGMTPPTLSRLHFHGNPVIRGDVLYMMVSADQRFGFFPVPSTYLLAFDANPSRVDIRLGGPLPRGFRMRQPDIAASTNKSVPERFNTLQNDQADLDTASGVIRFENMMSGSQGQMRNAFSASMPVIVSGNGVPETMLDPNTTGSKWSPLLWYFGISGFRSSAPAMVMGNTLYAAGSSSLDDMLGGVFPPSSQAALFGMDSDIPVNDPSIVTIPGYPGLRQVRWLITDPSAPAGFRSNPHVRWPSGIGVQSLNDFRIRLSQTLLGVPREAYGIVAGDGVAIAWAGQGVFGFKRATTIVADEARIVELDSAGFANWASDMSFQMAQSGGTTLYKVTKLVRPTKAYKLDENEFAVVDTGADRIVMIDRSAGETRSIEKLNLDLTYRPDGWSEGDVQELKQPRDVAVWGDFVPAANNPFQGPPGLAYEYWVHYLIADTGNRRLIELVDRYAATFDPSTGNYEVGDVVRDGAGDPQIGKLVWHTPQTFSGKTWQFTSVKRFQIGTDALGNAQFVYVAAVGDMMPTRINTGLDVPSGTGDRETGGGPGGIVVFDPINGGQVINEVNVPAWPGGGGRQRILGINTISVRPIGVNGNRILYAIMYTDSSGVYEVVQNGAQWDVVWMMPNAVYESIRGVKLRAVAAKRLLGGDVLITSSYFGTTNSGAQTYGEVTQWVGNTMNFASPTLGLSASSVRFELPPVVGTRALRGPQFADRY